MLVEIEADQTWETPRRVYYKITDDLGAIHHYGPVFTSDAAFDAEAFKATVAAKVAEQLAQAEFEQVIG